MTKAEYVARRDKRRKQAERSISFNPEFTPHDATEQPRYRVDDRRFRWVERPSDGLRFVGKVHEIRMDGSGNLPYFDRSLIDHTGWFMDAFQDNTAWGEVYQLPARDGKNIYVPAISTKEDEKYNNHGAILDFHSTTDDIKDAIRWADSMAERYAEDEREYQARESARLRIEENTKEIKTAYAEFRALCREIRENCDAVKGLTEVRKLIRAEYRRVKAEVRKLRKENAKLTDNFWSINPEY